MRTRNAMQLKARVNARAREAGIPAQMMMQNYLLERLLERLSKSPWRDRVVVKGGMLISSLVGVASRTTMDLDTTVRGFDLTHGSAEAAFREIIAVEADDDWAFEFVRTEDIREADDYPGIRVHLLANYAPMSVPVTVDVTTGDRYAGLSAYDAVALAIAKSRGIVLMTGDRRLRRAAAQEGVDVTGTIGVLDRLLAEGLADEGEYRACIAALLEANGGVVRLPEDELRKRLDGRSG